MTTTPYHCQGKHFLITGASSGIGRAVAELCASLGARLTLSGRNMDRLNETMLALVGEGHMVIQADLLDEVERSQLVEDLDKIDGVFHSAGVVRPFPIKFIKERQYHEMMDINYKIPVLLTSALFKAKKINNAASIVFMSSISAHYPHKGGALYASAKAGLNAFSKTIALEYGHQQIRSNVIMAAMVRTPMFDNAEQALGKDQMDKHGELYPLGFGEVSDVANAALYLLSPASRWVTGIELIMDGGLTAGL